RRGVGELQVVTGVEPATGDVYRAADAVQAPVQDPVGAARHPRPGVARGVSVVQVGRHALERAGYHVRAVALVAVERDPGVEDRAEDGLGAAPPEPRPARADTAGGRAPVATGCVQRAEVEPVDLPD